MIRLAIVVPCYNEQEVLPETIRRLLATIDTLVSNGTVRPNSAVYLVDDGSRDATWSLIEQHASQDPRVHGIKLSRNRGHQNALLSGLLSAEGEAVVTIDADLQDDPGIISEMLRLHNAGAQVVYAVRGNRNTDSLFKRLTAQTYYRLLRRMGVDVVYNHADYRLLGRDAIEALRQYPEINLFLRGLIPLLGFKQDTVFYDRSSRLAGDSKYPLRRMLSLALDGVTSFSVVPLRIISILGVIVFFLSLSMITWIIYGRLFMNTAIPGWASSVIPIYFLGGVQLLSIGILGEYVAKIYLESKRRPRFHIEKVI